MQWSICFLNIHMHFNIKLLVVKCLEIDCLHSYGVVNIREARLGVPSCMLSLYLHFKVEYYGFALLFQCMTTTTKMQNLLIIITDVGLTNLSVWQVKWPILIGSFGY